MLTPAGLLVGFAFKAFASDESTLYVVNVCGHDSVGLPLARSMDPVDEQYIEHNGIDNLIVPISVGEPKACAKGDFSFCIDVVVHTVLIKKSVPTHHLFQHLTEKLLNLSLEWVQSECGVALLRNTCSLLGNPYYFSDVKKDPKSLDEVMKMAAELLKQTKGNQGSPETAESPLPDGLTLKSEESKERKKPLIQEVISSPGIKKGFLNGGGARLYGPEGSAEGAGKAPDPLAHIPESLRSKCKIIDTRDLGAAASKSEIQQPSNLSAPCLPPPTSQPSVPLTYSVDVTSPKWEIVSVEQKGDTVVARFLVPPEIVSLRDVELAATENALEINGTVTELPVPIDADGVKAKFVKASRTLVVTCPAIV